jgi:hypothetical protein
VVENSDNAARNNRRRLLYAAKKEGSFQPKVLCDDDVNIKRREKRKDDKLRKETVEALAMVASKNGATFEQAMQVSISKLLTPNLHRRFNKSNDTAAVVANVAGYIHNVSFLNPVTHLLGCSSL